MTYEGMKGMGQTFSTTKTPVAMQQPKLTTQFTAQKTFNLPVSTSQPKITTQVAPVKTLIPFVSTLTPLHTTPTGTIATMPEERYSIKSWMCMLYGSTSAQCLRSQDPEYTYMDASTLASFRNANLSVAELAREVMNPMGSAKTDAEKQSVGKMAANFWTWWKKCQPATWAAWMVTPGFGDVVAPKSAWNWFTQFGKTGVPICNKGAVNQLFKVKTQWTAEGLLKTAPVEVGSDPDKHVEYTPTEEEIAASPCPPGATLATIGLKTDEAAYRAQGCGVQSQLVSGRPDSNVYCCPPDYVRPGTPPPPPPSEPVTQEDEDSVVYTPSVPETSPPPAMVQDEEDAYMIEDDLVDESFFSRYKWPLALGGLAAVGAGAYWWYRRSTRGGEGMARNRDELPPPTSPKHPSGLVRNLTREVL